MPSKFHLTRSETLLIVLNSVTIIRELARKALHTSLARAAKGSYLFTHPRTCFNVIRMLSFPEIQPLVQVAPSLMFKYLTDYLGKDLSQRERASLLTGHYTFLKTRVDPDFFRNIAVYSSDLWTHTLGDHCYRIYLTFPRTAHNEGDLALIFEADHVDIYTLSFTIGPGSIAGLIADHVVYIARVQGKGRGLQLIRQATKNCLEISPSALLLSAVEGVAKALKLDHMVGIGADQQLSASATSRPEGLVHAYDEFWMATGGVKLDRNMYHLTVPMSEKPILEIKRYHRSRALRKRAFRKLVAGQVCCAFRDLALGIPSP